MKKINYKLFLKKRKQRISLFGVSPSFDWKIILSISIIIFLIGASYISYLYFHILNESLFEVEEDTNQQVIIENNIKQIERVIKQIEERSQKVLPITQIPVAVIQDANTEQTFDETIEN